MSDDSIPPTAPVFTPVPNLSAAPAPPEAPAPKVKKTKRTEAVVQTTDPVTAVVTTSSVITDVALDSIPPTATLAAPYAYYDDDGALRSWSAGQVLVDPDEIAMLLDRGALFTPE